jgi:hypothetical protein
VYGKRGKCERKRGNLTKVKEERYNKCKIGKIKLKRCMRSTSRGEYQLD